MSMLLPLPKAPSSGRVSEATTDKTRDGLCWVLLLVSLAGVWWRRSERLEVCFGAVVSGWLAHWYQDATSGHLVANLWWHPCAQECCVWGTTDAWFVWTGLRQGPDSTSRVFIQIIGPLEVIQGERESYWNSLCLSILDVQWGWYQLPHRAMKVKHKYRCKDPSIASST